MKEEPHIDVLEYNKIDDHIFLGNNMCCQAHFEKELIKKGVTADISLEYERLDSPEGAKYFLWLPVKDYASPTITALKAGTAFMHAIISDKGKVYVHCRNGHGRSPALVIAYYMTLGYSFDEAYELVKKKRPVIHLQPSQTRILRKFEKLL